MTMRHNSRPGSQGTFPSTMIVARRRLVDLIRKSIAPQPAIANDGEVVESFSHPRLSDDVASHENLPRFFWAMVTCCVQRAHRCRRTMIKLKSRRWQIYHRTITPGRAQGAHIKCATAASANLRGR